MNDSGDEQAIAGIRLALADAVERLVAAGARDEALATYIPRHRRMLLSREAVLQPLGRVWRLGVLLLDREGVVRATGAITRATEPGRPAYQSLSAEDRRALRAAAMRGHFGAGETVNFDAVPIELDARSLRDSTGPLLLRDGRALVKWSSAADSMVDFATYLKDRVALLTDPPEGA